MKRLFILLQLAAVALFAVSCDKHPDGPDGQKPEIQITPGEATAESVSFKIEAKNVSLCAWVCLDAGAEIPAADQIFSNGKMADAESQEYIVVKDLQPDTEYLLAVAGKGNDEQVVASAKLKTSAEGVHKADMLIAAFYRTDNEAGVGQYNLILSNAAPGGMGEPVNIGDFQLYLNLYNVNDPNPIHASLPVGEYVAKNDFSAFSWNPKKDVFMCKKDDSSQGMQMMAYDGGTIAVSKEKDIYTIEADLILFNGEAFNAKYVGKLPFERTGSSNERFDTDQNVNFEITRCDYYGNWFRPHCDDVMLDFFTGTFDAMGNQTHGYYLTIPAYMDKQPDPYAENIRLQEGVYTVSDHTLLAVTSIPMYCQMGERLNFMDEYFNTGTYLQYIDGETGQILVGLAVGGTMTVKHVGEGYRIEFDFISSEGIALKGVYEGELELDNKCDNDQSAPKLPLSTLTDDHELSIPADAKAGAYLLGDYLVPGLNSWLLIISPEEGKGGDMITAEFFTEGDQFEMRTYEINRSRGPLTALPGFRDYGNEILYTWYGDMSSVDANGNVTTLGPIESGSYTVAEKDGVFDFVFDFVDDAGNKISGSWNGPVEVKDLRAQPTSVKQALMAKAAAVK